MPGAKWTIVQESPTTTVIDGHWGFGFHVNAKAMALTIEKAKTANVAACTVFRQSHVGRLAAYPADGDAGRHDRHRHRRFRPLAEASSRRSAAARRGSAPTRSRSRCRRTSRRRSIWTWRPRRSRPERSQLAVARGEEIPTGWIIDSRGTAYHRSQAISQGRRAAAARRQRGLQGQRPGRDGRGAVRPADRAGLRRRADRAAQ